MPCFGRSESTAINGDLMQVLASLSASVNQLQSKADAQTKMLEEQASKHLSPHTRTSLPPLSSIRCLPTPAGDSLDQAILSVYWSASTSNDTLQLWQAARLRLLEDPRQRSLEVLDENLKSQHSRVFKEARDEGEGGVPGRGELERDETDKGMAFQVQLAHKKLDAHGHVLQQIACDIAAIMAKDRILSSGVDSTRGGHAVSDNGALAGRALAASAIEAISSTSISQCSKSPEPEQPYLSLGRQSCPSAAESAFGPAISVSPSTSSTPNPMLSSVTPAAAFATWSKDGEIEAIHQDNFVAASSPSSLAGSATDSPLPTNPFSAINEMGSLSAQGSLRMLSTGCEDLQRSQVSGDLGYVSEGQGFKSLDVVKSPYSADFTAESLETVSLEIASLDQSIATRLAGNATPSRHAIEAAQQSQTPFDPNKVAPDAAPVRKSRHEQETVKDSIGSSKSSEEWAILGLLAHDVIVGNDSRVTTAKPLSWRHQASIPEENEPQTKPAMTSKEIAAMLM
jgi:hypothetical protein